MSQGHFNRFSTNPAPRNSAYEKYKASLHAFFDGKVPLPETIRQMAPQADEAKKPERISRRLSSNAPAGYDIFVEAIKRSSTPDEVNRTVEAFLESGFELPQDEEILSKALAYRDENVVKGILQKLGEMIAAHPSKSPRLLKTRLENASLLTSSSEIKELCQSIRAQLCL